MVRRFSNAFSLVASMVSMVALSACSSSSSSDPGAPDAAPNPTDTDSQSLADDGTDTSAAEGDGVSLTGTLVSSSGSSLGLATVDPGGGDLSLEDVGAGAKLFFAPLGCLKTANPTASSVTYTFDDCTGPRGLVHITGVVDVKYASSAGTLDLSITSTGLAINKATVDWDVTAKVTASGANRTMEWTGTVNGTTRGGRTIARNNDKTLTWTVGGSCFEINGSSTGSVTGPAGTREITTSFQNYDRCKASCPEAGSMVTITNDKTQKTVSITYGTGNATFTNAEGAAVSFVPLCASL